jgi:hypothetical protein
MSQTETTSPDGKLEEKKLLMQRAQVMGLRVSPNIGLDTLRLKIKEALESGERPSDNSVLGDEPNEMKENKAKVKETESQLRRRLQQEAMKLVRLRITCLNPNKKDLQGEIYTVGNKYIGTVRKYVAFGAFTDNGYHVPHCIYLALKDAKFLQIQLSNKPGKDGTIERSQYVPEFALEVLPQLTPVELRKLALQQAAAAGSVTE